MQGSYHGYRQRGISRKTLTALRFCGEHPDGSITRSPPRPFRIRHGCSFLSSTRPVHLRIDRTPAKGRMEVELPWKIQCRSRILVLRTRLETLGFACGSEKALNSKFPSLWLARNSKYKKIHHDKNANDPSNKRIWCRDSRFVFTIKTFGIRFLPAVGW